jgi:hypothetical protein
MQIELNDERKEFGEKNHKQIWSYNLMLVKIGKINDNCWHFDPSASKHISKKKWPR